MATASIRPKTSDYDRRAGDALKWGRQTSAEVRDIHLPPAVADSARRAACEADLERFLLTYFAESFPKPFSDDHRRIIARIQRIVCNGGLHAIAMPRGRGKTTILERSAIWAILIGRRRFVSVVASTERAAQKIIRHIKIALTYNALLYADFPNEVHGVPQLQGDNRRAGGQLCEGERTLIEMGASQLVMPSIPGSRCAASVFSACGITGNIRGQLHATKDGESIRPDMIFLDDPQTKESAKSAGQTQERLEILEGDILGLAGPGQSLAATIACTVIERDDLSDRVLAMDQWHGERTKTLASFPANLKLWDEYFEVRSRGMRIDGTPDAGNEFYLQHRAAMDEGAIATWEADVSSDEISAVQHAMNLWYRSPSAFASEYQNEPIDLQQSMDVPRYRGLDAKLTKLLRGIVPTWATHLTAGIDVQQRLLYYAVVAWADDFTGAIVDYGACPQQPRHYFTLSDASPTLQSASGTMQLEPALWWGMQHLVDAVLKRTWRSEGGGELKIGRALIDSGWGDSTETVFEFCRRAGHPSLMPAKGVGIGAAKNSMNEWGKQEGDSPAPGKRFGWFSRLTPGRAIRRVLHDTNHWKTFLAARAAALPGERGSLQVFGDRPEMHRMLADHLAAETCIKTIGPSGERWEWSLKVGEENHLLDCLVMSGVAASMLGCTQESVTVFAPQKPVKFSQLQKARR